MVSVGPYRESTPNARNDGNIDGDTIPAGGAGASSGVGRGQDATRAVNVQAGPTPGADLGAPRADENTDPFQGGPGGCGSRSTSPTTHRDDQGLPNPTSRLTAPKIAKKSPRPMSWFSIAR